MKYDTIIPRFDGLTPHKIVRIQTTKAKRRGISSMGHTYLKGDPILHIRSNRRTGEAFVILPDELAKLIGDFDFSSPDKLTAFDSILPKRRR